MTLAELHYKIKETGDQFNTWWIPMKKDGKDYNIELNIEKDENGNYFIGVKEE